MIKFSRGFTMVEVLIVVVMIGILVAVAYPQYREYVVETSRTEAHSNLLRLVDMQERFYIQNNTYATVIGTGAGQLNFVSNPPAPNALYDFSIEAADNTTFTLLAQASAAGSQSGDATCLQIRITSAGQRTPAVCW